MQIYVVSKILCLGLIGIAAALDNVSNSTLSKREISFSEVKSIRGALLFKNGRQTTCEVGLISMKAGFIAASCFDYKSGTNIDTLTKYEIYIQDGSPTPIISTLSPSDITLHPDFNPNTFENNIAVIQFNKGTADKYIGYVVTDRYLTDESAYVRRTLNPATGKWNDPVMTQMIKNQDDCSNFSGLYASNIYELACSPFGTASIYQSSCTVPYGTVYTRGTGTPGLIGVMSYMVVEGDSTCKDGSRFYVYYTKLWSFDRFATSVLGYPINVLFRESPSTEPGTKLYVNDPPKSIDMSGKNIFSGDFYAIQGANQNSNGDNKDTTAVNTSEPVSTSDKGNSVASETRTKDDDGGDEFEYAENERTQDSASESESEGSNEKEQQSDADSQQANSTSTSGGLGQTQIIVIGVVVPIAALLVGFITFLVFRYFRGRKEKKAWDPIAEENYHRNAALDLGGFGIDVVPPPYERTRNSPDNRPNLTRPGEGGIYKDI
ncbi:hypothetical protein J3B02_002094 [Coemansia erecta]|uniref:Peptidase S1 domain-containing protein n=1 Tax=Coemansia asiatica TaxID=1052880 RepID=A0A9W8CLP4_9FUNG|nr:hypothetical protein LPJ64_001808 [Coemansia asiatica]KAJ2855568.1 hypothetical protein J3B02_002094 [Coemansia erecta]KAJ2888741.1 hypothetical protein FB639_000435 [Coemansia asiatica]